MASHAFAPPSVGLWVVSPANLPDRLPKIAAFVDGMISDVFVPGAATSADMAAIRATPRPDGTKLRAQLWTVPGALPVAAYVSQVLADVQRLSPGVVELNIEMADAKLPAYIAQAVAGIRASRPKLKLRVDIAPFKGFALTGLAFSGDPNLYACSQAYYGDMSPVSADESLRDLLEHGVPAVRASVCYGAAGPIGWTQAGVAWMQARHATLGSLYYSGQLVRRLRSGIIFQDDLLVETGRL